MKKIFTIVVLPAIIILLCYLIVSSILEPVNFEKDRKIREDVAAERLKDIRTLQVTFKSKYNRFTPDMDSLVDFFKNDTIIVVKQVGSMDDSLAVAEKRVYRENIKIAVKDTLFKNNLAFNPDSLRYIPFSGKKPIEMKAVIKMVSGVNVPLFEATAPFKYLLDGLNEQLIINLIAEREDTKRFPGLKVGSVDVPNNNAGNWE